MRGNYMLLCDKQTVKRGDKQTPLSMSFEVIAHIKSLSAERKIHNANNVRQHYVWHL